MKPKLEHLFLTARVMTAVYRIASTAILLGYMGRRTKKSQRQRRVEHALDR